MEDYSTLSDRVEQAVIQLLLIEARAHRDEMIERLVNVGADDMHRLSKIERLILEDIRRRAGGTQGRRGAPSSPLSHLYPIMLYLAQNGVSEAQAWNLLEDDRPSHSLRAARRMFNKHRDPVQKAIDQAASAVVLGKPKTFATAYRRIITITE